NELHGAYCSVSRNVLHLLSDETITACFFSTAGRTFPGNALAIGCFTAQQKGLVLNQAVIRRHLEQVGRIPAVCRDCFNTYHCSRECPEVCYALESGPSGEEERGFRCRVNQLLAEAWLREMAGTMSSNAI
ncbi:hypothetical protein JXO59_02435, partial [candidate division KSB1 bacterium]|nr:hypothetical protein [candidate division KSB1 bacterium]